MSDPTVETTTTPDADFEDSVPPARCHLSEFQIKKFQYYFEKFFDGDEDGYISYEDFLPLQERIIKFTKWEPNSHYALLVEETHREFYECLLEKTKSKKVSLSAWLDMWGQLIVGSMGMSDFPYWVQLLPKLMFAIVDTNNDGIIDIDELRTFYRDFVKVEESKLEPLTKRGFRSMSAGGEYPLNTPLYEMIFANFLLGKNTHGPGKYIFGIFQDPSKDEPYKLIIPSEEELSEQEQQQSGNSRYLPHRSTMIQPRTFVPSGLM